MRIPNYTAEVAVGGAVGRYRNARAFTRTGTAVRPASCFGDCFQDCVSSGDVPKSTCTALCTRECGGKPPDNPPYQCTPQDNSFNHDLCMGAQTAWEVACVATCTATVGAIPGIGPACIGACHDIANKARADCPPAVICV